MDKGKIRIVGAREHNLKNISVDIPKEKLVVITGPSGSGKSSLALDTLYAEGKRRYVESLSSYARQFLGISKRPDVEKIEGLCPAIAIEQKTVGYNPRSTVGTITEVYDYLRVFFARLGTPHCTSCGMLIAAQSPERISKMLLVKLIGQEVTIAAPIAIQKKGEFKRQLMQFFERGFNRFLIDGKEYRFTDAAEIETTLNIQKTYKHDISVLVDRVEVASQEKQRLQEAIERAFSINNGLCGIIDHQGKIELYSTHRICVECVTSFPELEPRLFSFNSPIGACSNCHGLGFVHVNQFFKWKFDSVDDTSSIDDGNDDMLHQFEQHDSTCTYCDGMRLNEHALAVKIADKNIYELCTLSIDKLLLFFQELKLEDEALEIATPLLREIVGRLTFLVNVGLGYLTLARTARTLSGGEGQRIRLATQIGSSLSGVVYILDEPSIGLHQRDNDRLINTLKLLRDQGNTVVVVEHDMDTIAAADHLIDMGPAAGILGGEITAYGTPQEVAHNEKSLTGQFLSGKRDIYIPQSRRKPVNFLTVKGAKLNNLKKIDVAFPLGVFCAVSGVSGSGKSSLVMQTLAPSLRQRFSFGYSPMRGCEEIEGSQLIKNVVMVDQTPIGRTPRSNPATYLGIFDEIRNLYASLPESNARGYKAGQFSFNIAHGRCFECNGDGQTKVSMHFLEDVIVVCKACKGKRYNEQTLEILYKNKNIADILAMSVLEARDFFATFAAMKKRLDLLCDVGLDYLLLGQSSLTLSGGESQRIKLVNELSKRDKNTLYILDEPTTGLHSADVDKLLMVLNRLVDRGNTVLVIEHNLDVLKCVDYLIDIGPEGGDVGGYLVAAGTPEEVLLVPESLTGQYLKRYFSNK